MKKLILVPFIILLSGCTDSSNAKRVLESSGYSSVQITGYRFFGCSKDDVQHTGFEAKGPTGKNVTGVVCSGLIFKGNTIRLD